MKQKDTLCLQAGEHKQLKRQIFTSVVALFLVCVYILSLTSGVIMRPIYSIKFYNTSVYNVRHVSCWINT